MMMRVEVPAAGVYLIDWFCPDNLMPAGDAVVVDAQHAETSWCPVADVLVHRDPVSRTSAEGAVLKLLSHNASAIVLVHLGYEYWAIRAPGRRTTTFAHAGHLSMLSWAVVVCCWVTHGRPLSAIPCAARSCLLTPAYPDVPA